MRAGQALTYADVDSLFRRLRSLQLIESTDVRSLSSESLQELAKDCWDARNIPGLRYTPHTSNYYVHFTGVPERFRPLVKEYAAVKVAGGRTTATLRLCTRCLADFFPTRRGHWRVSRGRRRAF